jgi:hypothetical protein
MILSFLLLISGVVLDGSFLIKYSGEDMTWRACNVDALPDEFVEFEIRNLETDSVIAGGSAPYISGKAEFTTLVPRVGMYGARGRACNNSECSDWIESNGPKTAACPGSNYVYAILAPPGAPEI